MIRRIERQEAAPSGASFTTCDTRREGILPFLAPTGALFGSHGPARLAARQGRQNAFPPKAPTPGQAPSQRAEGASFTTCANPAGRQDAFSPKAPTPRQAPSQRAEGASFTILPTRREGILPSLAPTGAFLRSRTGAPHGAPGKAECLPSKGPNTRPGAIATRRRRAIRHMCQPGGKAFCLPLRRQAHSLAARTGAPRGALGEAECPPSGTGLVLAGWRGAGYFTSTREKFGARRSTKEATPSLKSPRARLSSIQVLDSSMAPRSSAFRWR